MCSVGRFALHKKIHNNLKQFKILQILIILAFRYLHCRKSVRQKDSKLQLDLIKIVKTIA